MWVGFADLPSPLVLPSTRLFIVFSCAWYPDRKRIVKQSISLHLSLRLRWRKGSEDLAWFEKDLSLAPVVKCLAMCGSVMGTGQEALMFCRGLVERYMIGGMGDDHPRLSPESGVP